MTDMRIVHLRSVEALRAVAPQWNDLWRRSACTYPTLRAEHIAQWVEHFAPGGKFFAIAVEENGRYTAAMPLVEQKLARVFRAGAFPCNEWSSSGDFLWDDELSSPETLGRLFSSLAELPISLLWLDEILPESERWKIALEEIERRRWNKVVRLRWRSGRVRIGNDWPGYRSTWSRKHRQGMARCARDLAHFGDIRLRLVSQFSPGEASAMLIEGLDIENRSWKGDEGSSVLKTPGMKEFFLEQAELLARENHLELAFLETAGRPVAFYYGHSAKGVYHSVKIAYDPSYADCSPGQMLRYFLLERFFHESGRKSLDFLGPLTESHTAWHPELYTVARLAAESGRVTGKLAISAYKLRG
jgi:CelD/BcsL family acetyltransferase involved in cellulose biosynthesis